ncbi:MAG TPA: pyridoxal phosphate-dependent aminotransferase [Chitinophagales bacterium]|nr:pyridoxal phosphate-dependent aminotransferase [Chitinophagales bacterium]
MKYVRMPIEVESPEEMGYGNISYNLAESSIRDINMNTLDVGLKNLVLFYGEHKGITKLRTAITEGSKVITADDVLVTTGAATALFIVATTLLNPEDHLVVIRPNYGTNLETPRAFKCQMGIVDLKFENGFEIDVNEIAAAIQPNTRLISVTTPHNPSGKLYSEETIKALIQLAERHNCRLLVDETYRDLNFKSELKPYYAELSDRVISVSSVSKSFGAPGVRIGWIINRDKELMNDFLAAKEQITICNSVLDEEVAWYLVANKKEILAKNHEHINTNFNYLKQWFAGQEFLEWVEPGAGVVCFPRLKAGYTVDKDRFYETLFSKYGTIVGPGHWFEQDKIYMRIGFGYPLFDELKTGLDNLNKCFEQMARKV